MNDNESYDSGWLCALGLIAYLIYVEQTAWALVAVGICGLAVAAHLVAKVIERKKK